MKIQSLGHVVLKVADQKRSEAFYHGLLGLPICARLEEPARMTFFSLGNHHDFAVLEIRDADPQEPTKAGPGLLHVAFKIGEDLEALRAAKTELERAGVRVTPVDHDITQSLYFDDPDGNNVELYVDTSDAWKAEPQRVAGAKPLSL